MNECPIELQILHSREIAELTARVDNMENRLPTIENNDKQVAILISIVTDLRETFAEFRGTMQNIDKNLCALNTRMDAIEQVQRNNADQLKKLECSFSQSEDKSKVDIREILKKIATQYVPQIITVLGVIAGIIWLIIQQAVKAQQ